MGRALLIMTAPAGLGVLAVPVGRAPSAQPAEAQADVSWHHRMLYRIMKDMTQEMGLMADEMSGGDLLWTRSSDLPGLLSDQPHGARQATPIAPTCPPGRWWARARAFGPDLDERDTSSSLGGRTCQPQ